MPLTLISLMATTVYLGLVFWGFEKTTASDGNLIGTLNPLFIIILGVLFLKETVTRKEKIGLSIAVFGTLVTVIQPLLEGKAFAVENILGNTIILAATITWALFVLFSKRNFGHFSPLLITLHGGLVAAATYPILAYFENGFSLPRLMPLFSNQTVFWGVFYMAFISYILAYILYVYGLNKIEISEASLFTYLQPLIATPLAVIFLHEDITLSFAIGALLIFAGVVLSEWKL